MANFNLEDVDSVINNIEPALAGTGLALTGATIAAPNPVTLGAAATTNVLSALLDAYQAGRSFYKGDYSDAWSNVGQLLFSLIGAKTLNSARKAQQLDIALTRQRAPRTYVTRGYGNNRYRVTQEHNKAMNNTAIGVAANSTSDAIDLFDFARYKLGNQQPIETNDNTSYYRQKQAQNTQRIQNDSLSLMRNDSIQRTQNNRLSLEWIDSMQQQYRELDQRIQRAQKIENNKQNQEKLKRQRQKIDSVYRNLENLKQQRMRSNKRK